MKKVKYLLLFIIFFVICPNVEAKTDYNYWNYCDGKNGSDLKEDCSTNQILSIPSPKLTEVDDDNPRSETVRVFPNYNFLLLIDTSNSMEKEGFLSGGDRKSSIVSAIKKFIGNIEDYDKANSIPGKTNVTSSTISYILSKSVGSVRTAYDGRRRINRKNDFDYDTGGNTLLQDLWKGAYDYFKSEELESGGNNCNGTNSNVPIVILFTDGYPNTYSSVTNVRNVISPSLQKSSIYTEFSSLYAYSTVSTMISFIDNVCDNVKIYNFGVGMHSDDAFAKYLLNPTSSNRAGLTNYSSSNPATASSHLSTLLNGGKVYESTASVGGGNPEYGFFSSSLGEITVNGNQKTTLTYSTSFNSKSLDRWNDSVGGLLYLSILLPKGRRTITWSNISRVEYSTGGSFVEINKDKIVHEASGTIFTPYDVQGELEHFTIGIKKSSVSSPGSITQVRIVFDFYDRNFEKFGYIQVAGLGNMDSRLTNKVNSYVGVDTSVIENMLKDTYGQSFTRDITVSGQTRRITKVTHNSCVDFSVDASKIFSSDVYVKVSKDDLDPLDPNLPSESCVKINKNGINSIGGVVTESLKLEPGGPEEASIYAGGGFKFSPPTLSSNVKWYFSKLYVDSHNNYYPIVKIVGQDMKNIRVDGSTYFTHINGSYRLDELYSDGQCRNSYGSDINSIENKAWRIIDGHINKIFTFNDKVKSNDWNKYDSKSEVSAPLSTEKSINSPNGVKDSNLYSNQVYTISYTSSLHTAYINGQTHLVDYKPNENFYNDSDVWVKQTQKLYYVSLDYPDKPFNIKYKEDNYSLIGINNYFKNTCSILVENILYDIPDGDPDPDDPGTPGKKVTLKYHYRPIDVSNPFPTGKIFPNWAEWYQDKSNQNRLSNTYSNYGTGNGLYSTSGGSSSDGGAYFDWGNMNPDGSSKFVSDFSKKASSSSYCGLGKFEDKCDSAR